MKSKIAVVISLFLCFAVLFSMTPAPAVAHGPTTQYLRIKYYPDTTTLYAALKAGDIQLMGWPLTATQRIDAFGDPNLVVCPTIENGMYEFDMNNNYTNFDHVKNPLHELVVRQAIAYCVNKPQIITTVCGGDAVRLDTPYTGNPNFDYWAKAEVGYPNYPYEYNEAQAAIILDAAGFTIKGADTWRSWPDGSPLPQLKFYIRTDHQPRRDMGRNLRDILINNLKIDCGIYEGPSSYTYPRVMGDRDYHIYTGGWSVGADPTTLYSLYHTNGWYPYGPNYSTGYDVLGNPNYPDYDAAATGLYYALDLPTARTYARECQNIMVENCFCVWTHAAKGFYAYRDLLGVVNRKAYGTYRFETFMNAYRLGGQDTIEYGLKAPPIAINVITSSWVWDWQVLNVLYDSLLGGNPYDLAIDRGDQPAVAQDWKISTWVDPMDGITKNMITVWLREDAYCCDGTPLHAQDVEWCLWYHYGAMWNDWNFEPIMDMKKTKVLDDHTIEIYYNVQSVWMVHWPTAMSLFQKHVWDVPPLTEPFVEVIHIDAPILPGMFTTLATFGILPHPLILKDGIPLVEGVDYELFARDVTGVGDFCYNNILWLRPIAPCQEITVNGMRVGAFAGYWPGGLPAAQIAIGTAMYKYVSDDPLVYILLERADHYYVNPLLGELDWRNYDIAGHNWWLRTLPPPKNDFYYAINIYDVVMVATAYQSQGTAVPDANWNCAADLSSAGTPTGYGKINIYDVVTVTGKFGQKWGSPPPNPPPA